MNLLVTICARAGSKGVKNKNIKYFLGQPLVYQTLAAYQLFTETYLEEYESIDLAVNTDSSELIDQIKKTAIAFVHIPRKPELAGDRVSKTDVIKDTGKEMERLKKVQYDYIIDLDLTSPLRTVEDVFGMLQLAVKNPEGDVVVSMTRSRRSPYFNMLEKKDGYYSIICESDYVSRQQAPACFDMNASIYVYTRNFILSDATRKVLDGKVLGWEMTDTAILDIDSEEDYQLLELLSHYYYSKNSGMAQVRDRAAGYYKEAAQMPERGSRERV